jgi:hypothetical protein
VSSRLSFLLVLLFLAASASGAERPSRADLQQALDLYTRSVVQVQGPRATGLGIIVGADGQVLTSVNHVSLEAAQVRFAGQTLPATVVLANASLKVALVAAPAGTYPAVPVRVSADSPVGQWLIGVMPERGRQRARPVSGQARKAPEPFIDVDVALAPGSPLFDTKGRLVAVSVQRRGRGCRALPLDAVKRQLTRVAPP